MFILVWFDFIFYTVYTTFLQIIFIKIKKLKEYWLKNKIFLIFFWRGGGRQDNIKIHKYRFFNQIVLCINVYVV